MSNKISCGILIFDPEDKMLIAHPTGKQWLTGCWDIPKGCLDDNGENPLECAIREVFEETGLDVKKHKDKIEDLGHHEYIIGKDLHLFKLKLNYTPDVKKMKCTTYFIGSNDIEYPEVNDYKFISKSKLEYYLFPSLFSVIKELI